MYAGLTRLTGSPREATVAVDVAGLDYLEATKAPRCEEGRHEPQYRARAQLATALQAGV